MAIGTAGSASRMFFNLFHAVEKRKEVLIREDVTPKTIAKMKCCQLSHSDLKWHSK
jgi:hypothetical protein